MITAKIVNKTEKRAKHIKVEEKGSNKSAYVIDYDSNKNLRQNMLLAFKLFCLQNNISDNLYYSVDDDLEYKFYARDEIQDKIVV